MDFNIRHAFELSELTKNAALHTVTDIGIFPCVQNINAWVYGEVRRRTIKRLSLPRNCGHLSGIINNVEKWRFCPTRKGQNATFEMFTNRLKTCGKTIGVFCIKTLLLVPAVLWECVHLFEFKISLNMSQWWFICRALIHTFPVNTGYTLPVVYEQRQNAKTNVHIFSQPSEKELSTAVEWHILLKWFWSEIATKLCL